ncbi:putative nuclease HARBI1 [Bactrocera neohumeralis]|uniref:putative nuclease HARBI1 n=1 Tax=Bactrocera neohumeralis TaxID=98809 RepID=UPI0021665CD2|nr:putative nuclease HARBI1 [Bactrocera neohumeralis]
MCAQIFNSYECVSAMSLLVITLAIRHVRRLCVALHYYATGSFLRDVGQDFVCPISKTMVSRIVHQIAEILQNHMAQRYIIFPTNLEQQNIAKQRFFTATGFPGILGAIDCTHVKIKKPPLAVEHFYINRKGYFSKNVQLVCDFDLNILACFARYGGSGHDAYIWESSTLKSHMLNEYTANGSTGWLLGESGYPLQPWLMTPFRNVESISQQRYNDSHVRARNCVERLNGVLKKIIWVPFLRPWPNGEPLICRINN